MQIEKSTENDHLYVISVFWKFHIATIYNFVVIKPWNLLLSYKVTYCTFKWHDIKQEIDSTWEIL